MLPDHKPPRSTLPCSIASGGYRLLRFVSNQRQAVRLRKGPRHRAKSRTAGECVELAPAFDPWPTSKSGSKLHALQTLRDIRSPTWLSTDVAHHQRAKAGEEFWPVCAASAKLSARQCTRRSKSLRGE